MSGYFLYTEDADFCAAIRARGRRVLFAPSATVTHLRGRSRATAPAQMNVAYRRSHLAFYEKHYPGWAPILRALPQAQRRAAGRRALTVSTANFQLPTMLTAAGNDHDGRDVREVNTFRRRVRRGRRDRSGTRQASRVEANNERYRFRAVGSWELIRLVTFS